MASKRVMVAVDDTEVSAHAFQWVLDDFIGEKDHVIVLSAAPFVTPAFPHADIAVEYGVALVNTGTESEKAEKQATSYHMRVVQKFVDLAHERKVSCVGEVVKGDAGTWIVDEAQRVNADAIVVGSNDKGVLHRTLVGSVSDYVLHHSPCTVGVVRYLEHKVDEQDVGKNSPRKVVIAVDDSREAIYAFTWALKYFCRQSDHVVLYHVHHPILLSPTGTGTGQFGMEEIFEPIDVSTRSEVQSLKESQKVVEKFMAYADRESNIHCEGMVVTGQTEAKVIEGLNALKADAVVVGTHDRSAVARTFLGSVSDYLAHNSPCPLIVAKPRKEEKSGDVDSKLLAEELPGHEHST